MEIIRQGMAVPASVNFQIENNIEKHLAFFLSEETKRSYKTDLLDFFAGRVFSEKDILRVSFEDVIEWRNTAWESQILAPSTINRKLTAIKKFFDPMVARGLMAHNPADPKLVKRLRDHGSQELKLGLSQADMKKLIEACGIGNNSLANLRDRAAILLAYSAMLRRSEVINARWEDLQKAGNGYVLKLPKTKTGANDFVPLDDRIFDVLNQYYKAVAEKLIHTDKFLKFKD
ncbi:MAG: site-specific integrase, partial [Desulforegulaceae bacterium]|nr:site-specific integrase [Desulforegulaceae bacterium]